MISLCWKHVNVLIDADYDELNTYNFSNFTYAIISAPPKLLSSAYVLLRLISIKESILKHLRQAILISTCTNTSQ
jgi:hypothetical protein